jgi:predicted thioesterase
MSALTPGMTATIERTVLPEQTAEAWGNELPVLATPVLLWFAELACMRSVESRILDHQMTLGLAHASKHMAPTPVGATVTVTAELISADDTRLSFQVSATDDEQTILVGTHERALVDADRFRKHIDGKRARIGSAVTLERKGAK